MILTLLISLLLSSVIPGEEPSPVIPSEVEGSHKISPRTSFGRDDREGMVEMTKRRIEITYIIHFHVFTLFFGDSLGLYA
jgi:hypothetical protein